MRAFHASGLAVASLLLIGVAAACGISTLGTGGALPEDAGTAPLDAGTSNATGDVAAPEAAPPCAPTLTFTDPLSTIDATRWLTIKDSSNGDHPKVVMMGSESPLSGSVVSLLSPNDNSSRGGIWLAMPVPTRALDVKLSLQIVCTDPNNCADGFAIAWLDSSDKSVLDTAASGRTFGIPPGVDGGAMSLDLWKNSETTDPDVPYVGVLAIDGSKNLGYYPWNVMASPKTPSLVNALHTIALRLRAGALTVSVDDVTAASGAVPSGFSGLFGITAGTGGANAVFLVRDVTASFYDCDP
jgi:hypothetical protein